MKHITYKVLTCVITCALAQQNALATGGVLKVKNLGKKQILTQIVGRMGAGNSEVTEKHSPNVNLANGDTHTQKFSTLTKKKIKLKSTEWMNKPAEGSDKNSKQSMPDDDPWSSWEYTLMYSADNNISYAYPSRKDLDSATPVAEDSTINVVAGVDQSGQFPATVIFMNDDTASPYDGILVSQGSVEVTLDPEIPAVSEWGLIVLALIVFTVGTVALGRRRQPATA